MLISWRNALRVVEHFTMELLEEDGGFNGANDISLPAVFYPLTPAQTLGAGTPDAETANQQVVLKQSDSWLLFDPWPEEGKYGSRVDLAGSVLVHFCIHSLSQCGKTDKYCCDETSRVCLEGKPDSSNNGYCHVTP